MDKRLEANMRFLCDESRMLTGITVAYGTTTYSEWAQYGRAQEIDRVENGFIPAVRPLIPDTIYDLASLTKLFTAVVTLALVESGQLSLDETVGQIRPSLYPPAKRDGGRRAQLPHQSANAGAHRYSADP